MGYSKYCFDVDAFAADEFSVAAFLEDCRTHNPMETVHQDLKDFQTSLENQLVAIINEDYAEFLQLSSKLKGVDEAVSSVRLPILAILKRVDLTQLAVSQLQSKIHHQLKTFEDLRKSEQDLQLSIRISEKILLLEELLEISSPLDEENEPVSGEAQDDPNAEDDDDDDGFDNFETIKLGTNNMSAAETCARLERATQNLVQLELEFYEGADIPTIQREEKRLAVIEETLLRRLETEFATEIFPDTFYSRDHTISASTLSYLLRAYVLLQKSHIPEEMIGRLLVLPFAEENVTRGRLDGRVRGSCEGLQQIYDSILEFISSKFKDILALPICQGESKCSVDILGNAIWKPLFDIFATKHGIIFQAADPDRFHQSYTQSMRFLTALEAFCVNETMKMRFRCHESVVEFKEKWNMDVYFQLRFAQLAASLEKAFGVKRDEQIPDFALNGPSFLYENSRALWTVLRDCWAEHVFLKPLVPSFSKLCLQLIVFYISIWKAPLIDAVEQFKNGSKIDFNAVPLYFVDNEEDLICAGSDFHILNQKIVDELFPVVKKKVEAFVDSSDDFVADFFAESLEELESCCWTAASIMIAEECKKVLPALRTVKGQYQMTNKPPPSAPSSYVGSIISPLREFLGKWGIHFAGARKHELFQSILDDVCDLYGSLSMELLKSAMELEESLKSRKMQRNLSSSLVGTTKMSDTEKMRRQLLLDLQEMQRQVLELGFELESCPAFQHANSSLSSTET
uniref:Conserved oligomeric Golgi complex subunit 2 n=1 Tax=Globisporangium ultimum (strain ATCC 200006 / CBS 805.95 / DAOM BR144) TaxID=431595 RepID=K3WK84_GLOUD